ncbi:hypothetical protein E8E12_009868 [Didymella heteroderae]|uniref:Uncharacterized protein n=1 Tax=Didymella heteroderae TaxID=1769908 RepID=A0A9P4WX57_9PLEO|nr:hypothetical protein E8E12_009868 [Didymella heteroderae]
MPNRSLGKTSTSPSTPQPLTVDNVRRLIKGISVSSKKPKASRPVSPERTFLCQDKKYPRTLPKPPLPSQKTHATSTLAVHWRGDDRELFRLDPAAKYNIRDYLLEQCKARTQTTNELTKPTGTKVVFVLRFNDDDMEQEALCVETNATTLYGIYNIRNAHSSTKEAPVSRKMSRSSAKDVGPRRLPRSRGITSLARLMASAIEEDFPLPDRELDSDSDGDQDESAPLLHTAALDTITEGNEDEEMNNAFVDVVDLGAPEYRRDPGSANHPEGYGRFKDDSHTHNVVDAELDFQERFTTNHNGRDSAAYYRKWRTLKHDHAETMVPGQSSLRNPVGRTEEEEDEGASDDELNDPTEQLLRLIAKKYGPLTLEGQKMKPAEADTNCSEQCSAKVTDYFDRDPYDDPWLSGQPFDDENEGAVSEPSTMFEGVADFSDDDATVSAAVTAKAQTDSDSVVSEEALEKLLNTSHEDFVNGYVRRYEVMRKKAAHSKQVRNNAARPTVPLGASEEAPVVTYVTVAVAGQVVVLPELVVTAATPASSPIKDVIHSPDLLTESETVVPNTPDASHGVYDAVSAEHIESAAPYNGPAQAPAVVPDEAIASQALPVIVSHSTAVVEPHSRPARVSSFCSSRDGSSLPASVFSRQTSVATKPSNESFRCGHMSLVDTLDLQIDAKPAPKTVSHHERSVSMPVLSSSASDISGTSINVSEQNHSALAQSLYFRPSTPIRASSGTNKYLTPIVEVQTSLSFTVPPTTILHSSTVMDNTDEDFSTPEFHCPLPKIRVSSKATRVPRGEPAQPMPASVFTDDSSFTDRRPRSDKFAAGIKDRFQNVASTTKQATQRALRSMKKMRAAAHYLVPAAFGSRNPFETVSRR